jgi:Capsule assembly protein Wzi
MVMYSCVRWSGRARPDGDVGHTQHSALRPVHLAAPVLGAMCLLAQAPAAGAGETTPLSSVSVQLDPFAKLRAIDAGRMASSWSSLPDGNGCGTAQRGLAGHVLGLAESDAAAQDRRTGSFDLIDSRYRVQADATAQYGCVFGQLAVQRQVGAQGDSWAMDGSALSWRIDEHWRVGAGLISRQWGPAWDGSLILGSAARPFLNASVEADSGPLPPSSFWWWLGEVNFSAFFGELEDERADYSRPYLMGARLVVRPWRSLELGLSRTAMWGGEGRDNSLEMFWNSLIGRDNQEGDPSLQPGNGLGGFDARWDVSQWLPGIALYGQMIGEDEAANLPSKYMYLAGADWRRDGAMAFVEWTDSSAKLAGVAYNHHIYTDGYRYKGRPLGHWADGDSNLWTIGGLVPQLAGGQALAVLRYGTLNDAGVSPTWPASRMVGASLQWRTVVDRVLGLTFAFDYLRLSDPATGDTSTRTTHDDAQLRVQLDWWLN